jgi:hypothetical protein
LSFLKSFYFNPDAFNPLPEGEGISYLLSLWERIKVRAY